MRLDLHDSACWYEFSQTSPVAPVQPLTENENPQFWVCEFPVSNEVSLQTRFKEKKRISLCGLFHFLVCANIF